MVAKLIIVAILSVSLANFVYMTPIDDHKPFDCPKNEKYYKCELEVCFKHCAQIYNIPCPQIAANCYKPSCECIDHYIRITDGGPCIPVEQCPKATKP